MCPLEGPEEEQGESLVVGETSPLRPSHADVHVAPVNGEAVYIPAWACFAQASSG